MTTEGSEGPLAEFAALRNEIDSRNKVQVQLFTLQLTLSSAVFGFAVSRPGFQSLLLILPLSSYLLSARFVAQQTSINLISSYILEELNDRVPGGLGWERWLIDHRRPDRIHSWTLPLLLTYPGTGLLALAWSATTIFGFERSPTLIQVGLAVVWFLGLGTSALCIYLITPFSHMSVPRVVTTKAPVGKKDDISVTKSLQP